MSYSVPLRDIMDEFQLEDASGCKRLEDIEIKTSDVNRPGLQIAGYFEYFGADRIQIIGNVETAYLGTLPAEERCRRLDDFFRHGFPCMVVARNLDICPELLEVSRKYQIPVLKTEEITSRFLSGIIQYLNFQLAPRVSKHGVLVEVYGEGILILGESGVGKSETALELVRRGHRLVADDVVEIRKVSEKTLVGTAPDIIRHFIEIRGIGVVDVKNLYGVGAVKMTENINQVVNLELWDESKSYDRLGLVDEYTDVLGIEIPFVRIPVMPGRNLAIIVEVAAMNSRQKKMGYNAAKVLNERVTKEIDRQNSR